MLLQAHGFSEHRLSQSPGGLTMTRETSSPSNVRFLLLPATRLTLCLGQGQGSQARHLLLPQPRCSNPTWMGIATSTLEYDRYLDQRWVRKLAPAQCPQNALRYCHPWAGQLLPCPTSRCHRVRANPDPSHIHIQVLNGQRAAAFTRKEGREREPVESGPSGDGRADSGNPS